MLSRISKILLVLLSILFVIMMGYALIWKDLTSLTKVESLLLYGTGSVVIMGWLFISMRNRKMK
jgi:antibiotic biosynthesis monooxygenase (ABM) superfamily enzyme